jgi:hypothetical protein
MVAQAQPGCCGKTCNELLLCLREMHRKSPIVVERKRDFLNLFTESDFVAATLSGQVYEYEVKISRRDFLKDAEKTRNSIYALRQQGNRPNRFFYVTAPGVVTIDDIPGFAGWLEYDATTNQLIQRRKAPLLHPGCHGVEVLMRLALAMRKRK